jgi:hypothetical protein
MVKLMPDEDSAQAILKAVQDVVDGQKDYAVQVVGLHSSGAIGWYQGFSAVREYRVMPLAVYTRTRNGVKTEYEGIVANDPKLFAQFEEAMRVALLNSSKS